MLNRNAVTVSVASIALALCAACGPNIPSNPNVSPTDSLAPNSLLSPRAFPHTNLDGNHVLRIIDGDTFVTDNNVHVRVLGINSCEKNTKGGPRATAEAHQLLDGQTVKLTAEPGHDLDRYGRALRYVQLPDGRDYASVMVIENHTEVYEKTNDANSKYVDSLNKLDANKRNCDI